MRSEAEIQSSAREGKAFSNGTEWEIWSARWCDRCRNNDEETEKWCPIITVALVSDKTPREWTPRLVEWEAGGKSGSYEVVDTCTEFDERREYDGDGPEPDPEPRGQPIRHRHHHSDRHRYRRGRGDSQLPGDGRGGCGG